MLGINVVINQVGFHIPSSSSMSFIAVEKLEANMNDTPDDFIGCYSSALVFAIAFSGAAYLPGKRLHE